MDAGKLQLVIKAGADQPIALIHQVGHAFLDLCVAIFEAEFSLCSGMHKYWVRPLFSSGTLVRWVVNGSCFVALLLFAHFIIAIQETYVMRYVWARGIVHGALRLFLLCVLNRFWGIGALVLLVSPICPLNWRLSSVSEVPSQIPVYPMFT